MVAVVLLTHILCLYNILLSRGAVLNAATSGTPVVVLHHTGGAAEKLGIALQERRKGGSYEVHRVGYQIPDSKPLCHQTPVTHPP